VTARPPEDNHTMRAILVDNFGSVEAAKISETPAPVAGPHEVIVEVHAAPVNFVDLVVISGT
jgi:NADPH2:quinone reductase